MLEAQARATTTTNGGGGTASPPPSGEGSDTESVVSNATTSNSASTPAAKRRKTTTSATKKGQSDRISDSPPIERNAFMELAAVASHLATSGPNPSTSGGGASAVQHAHSPPTLTSHIHPAPSASSSSQAHVHRGPHHHHHHHVAPHSTASPVLTQPLLPNPAHSHPHPHSHLHPHPSSTSHAPHWRYSTPPSVLLPAPSTSQPDSVPTSLNLRDLASLRDALAGEMVAAKEQIGRLEGFVKRGDAFVKLLDEAVRQTSSSSSTTPAPPPPSSQPQPQPSPALPQIPVQSTSAVKDGGERKRPHFDEDDLDKYLESLPHQAAVKLPPRTKSAPAGLLVPSAAATGKDTKEGNEGVVVGGDTEMKENKEA